MSVVSAMSVVNFSSYVTACVLCLYLSTYSYTKDTKDIDNLIVRARETGELLASKDSAAPQISHTAADCTTTRSVAACG